MSTPVRRSLRRLVSRSALGFFIAASALSAQDSGEGTLRVRVVDSTGRAVPYAQVKLASGATRVANDSGRVEFSSSDRDSVRVYVRRIGFTPFDAWLNVADDGGLTAIVSPLPQNLGRVDIFAASTPLALRGFYDRMERASRGAGSAWFMTPEDLEVRNAARISHLLDGQRFVRIQRYNNQPLLTGRGGNCQFVVLLDGVRLTGMREEAYTVAGRREIERLGGGSAGLDRFMSVRSSIDDLITTSSVRALEVYASVAAAPAELQSLAGSDGCGIMAIWTGRR